MANPHINRNLIISGSNRTLGYVASNLDNCMNTVNNHGTRINNNQQRIDKIGTIYQVIGGSKSGITPNMSHEIQSIDLDPGVYVIVGSFIYKDQDLRYYLSLYDMSISAYDKNGYVEATVTAIADIKTRETIKLFLWISGDKTITIDNRRIKAVKIA